MVTFSPMSALPTSSKQLETGGSSSSSSSTNSKRSNSAAIFNSLEQAQEALILSQRHVCDQLYHEFEKSWKRFDFPALPGRAASIDGACSINPLQLLQRLQRNPLEQPVSAARAEGMVHAMELELQALTSPVIDVPLPQEGHDPRLIVIGDVHGQLQDVLHIFSTNGPPSEEVTYLFNGDIVDRGRYAVEIWLLLIAFKLTWPRSVHILRGNHENDQMIGRPFKMGGGFAEECLSKYSQPVLSAFQRLFKLLPLFAVLAEEVFVVHGGLFRSPAVNVETLRKLPEATWRRNYPNPLTIEQTAKGEAWTFEDEIIFDAQWADPHSNGNGSKPSSRGRVAVTFGEDVTHRFLDEAGLAMCLRSHRVPQTGNGFEIEHGGRLLTLFSASRYGGILTNRGAIAVFRPVGLGTAVNQAASSNALATASIHVLQKLHLSLIEHDVTPLKGACDQQSVAAAAASQVRRGVEQVVREHDYHVERYAIGMICAQHDALMDRCISLDSNSSGLIKRDALCEILSEVCGEMEWADILKRTAPQLTEQVAYSEFLSTPRVRWFHLGAAQVVTVARATAKAELRLSGLAALFDSLDDGRVTPELAREAIRQLLPSLREQQRHQLAVSLFGEEPTSLSAVLHQFALFADPPALTEQWMEPALQRLAALVEKHHGPPPLHCALIRYFKHLVPDGSDLLHPEDFVKGFHNLGAYHCSGDAEVPLLHTGRLYKLFEVIDTNSTGTVSFLELLLAMGERTDRPELPEFPAIEGRVPATLLVHKASLLRVCRALDPMDVGRISVHSFIDLVAALCTVIGKPLSGVERATIEQELIDDSGEDLAYEGLLGCFEVSAEGGPWQWNGIST